MVRRAPSRGSHIRAVQSIDPVATSVPSGEYATAVTGKPWSCPASVACGAPVAASQMWARLPMDPVARNVPSGENAASGTCRSYGSSSSHASPALMTARSAQAPVSQIRTVPASGPSLAMVARSRPPVLTAVTGPQAPSLAAVPARDGR